MKVTIDSKELTKNLDQSTQKYIESLVKENKSLQRKLKLRENKLARTKYELEKANQKLKDSQYILNLIRDLGEQLKESVLINDED